jgi:serine/threonine protein kinase
MSGPSEHVSFVAPLPTDLAPLFPGYEFQGLIATGGMGAVYRAVQKSLDRTVAIKILPRELSKDAAFRVGFEAEAKAMARLNHPNLIGVYDFGEVAGMLYIIMEFVPGKSLYHSSYGTAVDPKEVIRLIIAICDGLTHAHKNGIIHRDIKPSNILLDLNAQPKIGDFGLARPTDWKLKQGEEIFGTPHYTAPEVVNQPHSVDHRADIFSVGVMLYELLTGKLPDADPRPASTIVRCDPQLDAIIRRATQPLPATRYSSAEEMAKELRAVSGSKVKTDPRTGPMPQTRPTALRGKDPRVKTPRGKDLQAISGSKVPTGPRTDPMPQTRPPPLQRKYPQPQKKISDNSPLLLLLVVVVAAGAYFFLIKSNEKTGLKPPNPSAPAKPGIALPKPLSKQPGSSPFESNRDSDREPDSDSDSETTATPPAPNPLESEPESTLPAQTEFDISGFYAKARKIMQDRCKSRLDSHELSLKKNVDDLEKACSRVFRRLEFNKTDARDSLATELQVWKKANCQLPSILAESLAGYDGIANIYAEALQSQTALDQKLQADLAPQAAIYILGLEKEIERRKADDDLGAVTLIEDEIKLTQQDPAHFFKLMVGRNPSSTGTLDP